MGLEPGLNNYLIIKAQEESEPCGNTFKRLAWSGPKGNSYNSRTILAGNKTE